MWGRCATATTKTTSSSPSASSKRAAGVRSAGDGSDPRHKPSHHVSSQVSEFHPDSSRTANNLIHIHIQPSLCCPVCPVCLQSEWLTHSVISDRTKQREEPETLSRAVSGNSAAFGTGRNQPRDVSESELGQSRVTIGSPDYHHHIKELTFSVPVQGHQP